MRKQQSVCKIYYFPSLDGGGFEEVPTAEYQQPEKSIEELQRERDYLAAD